MNLSNDLLKKINEDFVHNCGAVGLVRANRNPNQNPCNENQKVVSNWNMLTTPRERQPVCCRPANNFASYSAARNMNNKMLAKSILRSITNDESNDVQGATNINAQLQATGPPLPDLRRYDVVNRLLDNFQGAGNFAVQSWRAASERPYILQKLLKKSLPGAIRTLQTVYSEHVNGQLNGLLNVSNPNQAPQFWKRVSATLNPIVDLEPESDLATKLTQIPMGNCVRLETYEAANLKNVPGICVRISDEMFEF